MAEVFRLADGTALPALNNAIDVVASGGFVTPDALSSAITTAQNVALAMVPKDGLKAPVQAPTESGIDRSNPEQGDNYYVANMDVNAPGSSGQVWYAVNGWNWKVDSHIPQDGVSIILQNGAESVNPAWLATQIADSSYIKDQPRFPLNPTHYELANFSTGANFTAPADGWLMLSGEDSGFIQAFVYLEAWVKPVINGTQYSACLGQQFAPGGYGALMRVTVPVRKGTTVEMDCNTTSQWYEFFY